MLYPGLVKIVAHSHARPPAGAKRITFVYDPDGRDSVRDARLIGSWDENGHYSDSWDHSATAMKKMPDGTFQATVALDPSRKGDWQYGVKIDGPSGKDAWAITEETNPHFKTSQDTVVYRSTSIHQNGATKHGEDIKFRYWAPNARSVSVASWDGDQEMPPVKLSRDGDGYWSNRVKDGWDKFVERSYGYKVVDSTGKTALMVDPYARDRMGPQRGIDDLFLHKDTGLEVNKFDGNRVAFTRFEVQEYPRLSSARLVLSDNGKDLTAQQMQERLGTEHADLVAKFHGQDPNDYWAQRLNKDGSIQLLKQGGAFAAVLPEAKKLEGLTYRFEGFDSQGHLLGDLNGDQVLQESEAKKLAFNDPFSNKISADYRSPRLGLIEENNFSWQHDGTPREAQKPADQVIYQLHPGSIFSSAKNVDRTSFKDITERLDYFKDLGVNVLELLPVNSFEGARDWGYIGSQNMSVSENYGFVDDKGRWVEGDEALKMLIDAAHGKGLKVFNDVVYNHFGGDFNNVWNVGGPENPWFEWSDHPQKPGDSIKHTPWGALPAYDKAAVRDYITNNALYQLDEFHFDGLRFDFTHPIHQQGENGGGDDGWEMLQKLNRTIKLYHPEAFTAAEEFPNSPIIVSPPSKGQDGGAGFDSMWNTEFQHRLVHDNSNPAVLQEAAEGHLTRVDTLMNQLLNQPGFRGPNSSVTIFSNHDEVGNADRTINVANQHRDPSLIGDWEKAVTRTCMGVAFLSPGMPLMFQGDESLATNKFSWGIPSTWDSGWEWKDHPDSPRYKHHDFSKALIALRKSSPAFEGDAEAHRVYTHQQDSVMAFSRKKGNEEYLVVASFNKQPLTNYSLPTDGKWEPVFTSDRKEYGGNESFAPRPLEGPQGTVDLPAGGLLVFRKV